jgi:predicted PurR-regulated permease PerM
VAAQAVVTSRSAKEHTRIPPNVITFILVVLVVACLALAKAVILPAAVAILLAFILNPFVSALDRRGVPRVPSVFLVVILVGGIVGSLGWILASQMVQFLNQLPSYQDNVTHRVEELRAGSKNSIVAKVEDFIENVTAAATSPIQESAKESVQRAKELASKHPGGPGMAQQPQPVTVVTSGSSAQLGPWVTTADALLEFLASVGMVIVLVIYVLINREEIRNRFLRLIGEGRMTLTTKALDDTAQGLSAYLLAQFMINASFGVVVGLGVWLVGLPYPLLWAVCSTFLRYIPFVGPWIALMFPLALSLAITPGWMKPLVIVAIFVGFELAANLAIEPLIYGQQMGVAPAPLLVAIAFWSWLWGAMGLVLAVPLTVCLVVLGKHVPALKFFDILLGDEPALTADVHFYQRLLARDEDEALEILRIRLQEIPLEQVFDEIVIPALITARTDFDAEALSEAEVAAIFEMIRELVEEIGSAQAELQARPATEPEAAAAPAPAKLMILGCAARDASDETALEMLHRILDPAICQMEIVSTDRLVSEVVELVAEERPSLVCIASLPPGGLAHTRLLCKRLRSRYGGLKIVVGRWGLQNNIERNRDQLMTAGADHFATTLHDSCTQIVQLGPFLNSLKESTEGTLASAAGEGQSEQRTSSTPTESTLVKMER